ncbi:unnamed protein product [Moneuplotes crassus]|uniref:Arf-GAP domain-containing protein n=1 Tax=Euplotes crassus TaxID=5936 RepID=A0AAD1UGI4_EUPCR|nr:unnamed protein product [Moneuplotes crassus]
MRKEKAKPQNKFCADCDTIGPEWISIKFGTFICIRCAGVHRELGTDYTFVQSAVLDRLKLHVVEQYQILDNEIMNTYYEHTLPPNLKPKISSKISTIKKFIKNKYILNLWTSEGAQNPVEAVQNGEYRKDMRKSTNRGKKEMKEVKGSRKKGKKRGGKRKKSEERSDLINCDKKEQCDKTQQVKKENRTHTLEQEDDFSEFVEPQKESTEHKNELFADIDINSIPFEPSGTNNDPFATPSKSTMETHLAHLYHQSSLTHDPNNKYAALEHFCAPPPTIFAGMTISPPHISPTPYYQSILPSLSGAKSSQAAPSKLQQIPNSAAQSLAKQAPPAGSAGKATDAFSGLVAQQWCV